MTGTLRSLALVAAMLCAAAAQSKAPPGASARQTRCGWIVNPTPANWWLVDRVGQWELGVQGGYQAAGLDQLPDLTAREWAVTNGASYGYGCGCLTATVVPATRRIIRVHGFTQKPLRLCRADRRLAKPE